MHEFGTLRDGRVQVTEEHDRGRDIPNPNPNPDRNCRNMVEVETHQLGEGLRNAERKISFLENEMVAMRSQHSKWQERVEKELLEVREI